MSGEKSVPGPREVHEKLARGMARRVGNVPELAMETVIERCRRCPNPGSCAAWQLDTPAADGSVPGYCLNADRFRDWAEG